MKAIYCDLFLLPQLCQILQDELPSRYHIIAQQWLDLCLGQNIFSAVKTLQDLNVLERQSGGHSVYLTESGEKNPGVLSLEAIKIVRPGGIHFLILRKINSGRVSLSRWGCRLLSTPNLSFLFFILSPRRTWMAS